MHYIHGYDSVETVDNRTVAERKAAEAQSKRERERSMAQTKSKYAAENASKHGAGLLGEGLGLFQGLASGVAHAAENVADTAVNAAKGAGNLALDAVGDVAEGAGKAIGAESTIGRLQRVAKAGGGNIHKSIKIRAANLREEKQRIKHDRHEKQGTSVFRYTMNKPVDRDDAIPALAASPSNPPGGFDCNHVGKTIRGADDNGNVLFFGHGAAFGDGCDHPPDRHDRPPHDRCTSQVSNHGIFVTIESQNWKWVPDPKHADDGTWAPDNDFKTELAPVNRRTLSASMFSARHGGSKYADGAISIKAHIGEDTRWQLVLVLMVVAVVVVVVLVLVVVLLVLVVRVLVLVLVLLLLLLLMSLLVFQVRTRAGSATAAVIRTATTSRTPTGIYASKHDACGGHCHVSLPQPLLVQTDLLTSNCNSDSNCPAGIACTAMFKGAVILPVGCVVVIRTRHDVYLKVRVHSSAEERCRPHVAIYPAMLRSSNAARPLFEARRLQRAQRRGSSSSTRALALTVPVLCSTATCRHISRPQYSLTRVTLTSWFRQITMLGNKVRLLVLLLPPLLVPLVLAVVLVVVLLALLLVLLLPQSVLLLLLITIS